MADETGPEPLGAVTKKDIVERLRLYSSGVVGEVFELAHGQLADEERRSASIAAKATTILGAAGLSVTVAFTFGGLLVQSPRYILGLGTIWGSVLLLVYGAAIFFGLGASLCALVALRVREHQQVNEDVVFDSKELLSADSLVRPFQVELPERADGDGETDKGVTTEKAGREPGRDDEERLAVARYRRFLVPHLWGIYQSDFATNEKKVRWLQRAQRFFAGFLTALGLIAGMMTATLLVRQFSGRIPVAITCPFPTPSVSAVAPVVTAPVEKRLQAPEASELVCEPPMRP